MNIFYDEIPGIDWWMGSHQYYFYSFHSRWLQRTIDAEMERNNRMDMMVGNDLWLALADIESFLLYIPII